MTTVVGVPRSCNRLQASVYGLGRRVIEGRRYRSQEGFDALEGIAEADRLAQSLQVAGT